MNKEVESIANKSIICYSEFPPKGEILQEVLGELGYKDIVVKEISCSKFILSLKTKAQKDSFYFENLSDWIILPRKMVEEVFRIKRKTLIEIRGLPCNAWSEENLQVITRECGFLGMVGK